MLGILIRGNEDVTVHTSGGLGFSVRDYQRPDLAPARPGYVYVTDADINPKPPAPIFKSVVGGSGIVYVELTCTETVDGFYLEWSVNADRSDATRLYSPIGYFEVNCNSTIYLWGASIRGTAVSDWTAYGEAGPDQEIYTEKWIDESLTGTLKAQYPNILEQMIAGNSMPVVYGGSDDIGTYWTSGSPTVTLGMWSKGSGVSMSEFGGKIECRALVKVISFDAQASFGFVFGADENVFDGWNAADQKFYLLEVYRDGLSSVKAKLSYYSAGAQTTVATSGNIYSYAADWNNAALVFERIGSTFTLTVDGLVAFSATDVTIPPSTSRIYCGMWFYNVYSCGNHCCFVRDYLRVYSRNVLGDQTTIDSGKYYDDLLGELEDGKLVAWDGSAEQIVAVSPQAAQTSALTTITHTAPGTPDYALQDLTNSGGFGFATKDEGNTALSVVANLQTRLAALETKLQALGLIS